MSNSSTSSNSISDNNNNDAIDHHNDSTNNIDEASASASYDLLLSTSTTTSDSHSNNNNGNGNGNYDHPNPTDDEPFSHSERTPPLSNKRKKSPSDYGTIQQRPDYDDYDHYDNDDNDGGVNDETRSLISSSRNGRKNHVITKSSSLSHLNNNIRSRTNSTGSSTNTTIAKQHRKGAPMNTNLGPPSTSLSSSSTTTGTTSSLLQQQQQYRSERSMREHKLNQCLECIIVLLVLIMIAMSTGLYWYYNIHVKHIQKQIHHNAIIQHAKMAQQRRIQCYNITWENACDNIKAGARRRRRQLQSRNGQLQSNTRQLIIEEPSRQHRTSSRSSSSSNTNNKQPQQHHYRNMHNMNHNDKNRMSMSRRKRQRRRHHSVSPIDQQLHDPYNMNNILQNTSIPTSMMEELLLESDDPAVTYDNNCLKVYRLDINHGQLTFPYHSSQLLRLGGNQTMVLIVQHGALRNSEAYFCSFKEMMLKQSYRNFDDILIIAPDYNYATDPLVHPNDAVWNSSKPWGDWRVGAESDPYGMIVLDDNDDDEDAAGTDSTNDQNTNNKSSKVTRTWYNPFSWNWQRWYNNYITNSNDDNISDSNLKKKKKLQKLQQQQKQGIRPTISSFDVLDHILAILTDKRLYPNVEKISFVGHSAGGQMIQRYAILSVLAALWFMDTGKGSIDIEFIIANPSSYTYLDPRRYTYNCGLCTCTSNNCTCDRDCTDPGVENNLQIPQRSDIDRHSPDQSTFPCYQWNYDRWPYGIGSFTDESDDGIMLHTVPYALRDGFVGVERALRMYPKLNMVYMVGQNDTCNDGLPTCSIDCWKRTNYSIANGEWSCFRNDMDTRCPAMLQGPYRRSRGYQYMKYLKELYGEPVHRLHTIPGVGHDAAAMFSSDIALKELFD